MGIFSKRIKELREIKGISQKRAAEDLEISPQNLSYYEKGRDAGYDLLMRMAKYYGVTVEYLIGATDAKRRENVNINEVTGLNDLAIDILESSKREKGGIAADIANSIIVSSAFLKLQNAVWDMSQRRELRQRTLKISDIKELKIKDLQVMKNDERYSILQLIFPDYNLLVSAVNEREIKDNIDIIAQLLSDKYIPEAKSFSDIVKGV